MSSYSESVHCYLTLRYHLTISLPQTGRHQPARAFAETDPVAIALAVPGQENGVAVGKKRAC